MSTPLVCTACSRTGSIDLAALTVTWSDAVRRTTTNK